MLIINNTTPTNQDQTCHETFIEDETYGLSNVDGIRIFEEILRKPRSHIMVSIRTNFENRVVSHKNLAHRVQVNCYNNQQNSIWDELRLIWQEALEVDVVDDADDFFVIGGDSLLSIQVSYQLKKQLEIDIEPHLLLSYPVFKDFVIKISSIL